MPDVTANNQPVLEARVLLPRAGAWSAEIAVDAATASQFAVGSPVALALAGGALTFQGTVLPGRVDAYAQSVSLRVVGGKHGLPTICTPRFYQGTDVQTVMRDVLSDAGETLSVAAQATPLATQLPFWTLVAQPAASVLSLLAKAVGGGAVWRVLSDGTVFLGVDAFPATALVNFELLDYMPLEAQQVISAQVPDVFPGESLSGRNVSAVEHHVTAMSARTKVWFE